MLAGSVAHRTALVATTLRSSAGALASQRTADAGTRRLHPLPHARSTDARLFGHPRIYRRASLSRGMFTAAARRTESAANWTTTRSLRSGQRSKSVCSVSRPLTFAGGTWCISAISACAFPGGQRSHSPPVSRVARPLCSRRTYFRGMRRASVSRETVWRVVSRETSLVAGRGRLGLYYRPSNNQNPSGTTWEKS